MNCNQVCFSVTCYDNYNISSTAVAPMVQDAKQVALNITDPKSISRWKDSNNALINAVVEVKNAVSPDLQSELDRMRINGKIILPQVLAFTLCFFLASLVFYAINHLTS